MWNPMDLQLHRRVKPSLIQQSHLLSREEHHQSNVPNGQRRRDVAVPEEKMYAVASHIQRSKGQIPLVVYHLFTGSNSRNEQEVTKLLRDTKHLQNLATSHLMISDNRARSCTARISLSLSLSRRSFALAGCCRHR